MSKVVYVFTVPVNLVFFSSLIFSSNKDIYETSVGQPVKIIKKFQSFFFFGENSLSQVT